MKRAGGAGRWSGLLSLVVFEIVVFFVINAFVARFLIEMLGIDVFFAPFVVIIVLEAAIIVNHDGFFLRLQRRRCDWWLHFFREWRIV
jgi:hypothetical protein